MIIILVVTYKSSYISLFLGLWIILIEERFLFRFCINNIWNKGFKFIDMWNLIASSKLTQERTQEKNYKLHKDKLKNIKSLIKIKEPEHPSFIYTKPKQQMIRRERLVEIDRQNEILLTKMQSIKESKFCEDRLKSESPWLKTLNQHVVEVMKEKIEAENHKMCDKLMLAATHYPIKSIMSSSSKLAILSQSISENARRVKPSKLFSTRPNSAYNPTGSRFVRSGSASKENRLTAEKQEALPIKSNTKGKRPVSAPSNRYANKQKGQLKQDDLHSKDVQVNQFESIFERI